MDRDIDDGMDHMNGIPEMEMPFPSQIPDSQIPDSQIPDSQSTQAELEISHTFEGAPEMV